MTNKLDLRVVKTRQAIADAFFAALSEEPFERMTVAELTRRARIGKATFYNHYVDKFGLAEHLIEDELDALRPLIAHALTMPEDCPPRLPDQALEHLRLLATIHTPEADFERVARLRSAGFFRDWLQRSQLGVHFHDEIADYLAAVLVGMLQTYIANSATADQLAMTTQLGELTRVIRAVLERLPRLPWETKPN